jgi:fluoroquinolone transport system ATP-binding protein
VITVSNLSYTYPGGDAPVLKDIGFTVERGEIFGLLGPSGAGKSTLQGVMTKRYRRYQGGVEVLGKSLRDWDEDYYRRIGVGFEFPNHYLKLTARENLNFFGSLYPGSVVDPNTLLEMFGLKADADKRVGNFSKGMKMRLNVARAIQHSPDILFLDEPTAGLDPVTAAEVKGIIRDQNQSGTTIILTTHNMHDVDELCDRVAFTVAGKLVAVDQPDALKLAHGKREVRVEYTLNGVNSEDTFPLDGLADNPQFQSILSDGVITTLHSQEATLDQVFAKVTGVALDTEE